FFGLRKNQDVVHVDDYPSFIDHLYKVGVHHSLERGRGVAKSKEHDFRFEHSSVRKRRKIRGGVPAATVTVSFLNSNIVVAPSKVQFGEIFGSLKFRHKVRDEGKRIPVLDSPFIQVTIVLTGS
ncbi:hypothetical protein M378DRAFT_88907, partial [Amanita muscaria Koide BX008]